MTHDHDPAADAPVPPDPDLDDVPRELARLDGENVAMIDVDGTVHTGSAVIVPGLFGHARRLRDGTYDDNDYGGRRP